MMFQEFWLLTSENPSVVAAIAAAFAAFAALVSVFLSFVALLMQRKHNRISVRPIVSIGVSDYEDRQIVRLRNVGIGPLRVDAFTVKCLDTGTVTQNLIDQMNEKGIYTVWRDFSGQLKGRFLRNEGFQTLLHLEGDPNDLEYCMTREVVRRALCRLEVKVSYSDVYGNRIGTETKQLSWFGRNFQ